MVDFTDYLYKCTTWGIRRVDTGIPNSTQTAPANFENSEHFCEVLTISLISRGVLDIREDITQVSEVHEAENGRMVDSEEGGLRALKETIEKKSNGIWNGPARIVGGLMSCPDPMMRPTYSGRSSMIPCSGFLVPPSRISP